MTAWVLGAGLVGCGNPSKPARSETPDRGEAPDGRGARRDGDGGDRRDGPGRPPPAGPPQNLLVVIADDLGTDQVSAYHESDEAPRTPRIDRLAAEGVLFRNAYTYPTCSSSRAAFLTGRYGRRNGMGGIVELDQGTYELPLREVLLPEALNRGDGRKYHSAAIGKWHLSGHHTPSGFRHPLEQGFDHHVGAIGNLVLTSKNYGQRGSYYHYERSTDGVPAWREAYVTTDNADDAIAALRDLPEPWLVYLAFNAPHDPVAVPPKELLREPLGPDATERQKYVATVEAMDHELGRVLDALTPKQRDGTVILFAGDNGSPHEVIRPPFDPEHGKGSLYEGGTGIPFIVAGAGVARPGRETNALVHSVDVLPTLLDLVGVPSKGLELDGVSFAPVLAGTSEGERAFVYTERFAPIGAGPYEVDMVAIRDARYKVLRKKNGNYGVYDLEGRLDDGEGVPLVQATGGARDRADRLMGELERLGRELRYEY